MFHAFFIRQCAQMAIEGVGIRVCAISLLSSLNFSVRWVLVSECVFYVVDTQGWRKSCKRNCSWFLLDASANIWLYMTVARMFKGLFTNKLRMELKINSAIIAYGLQTTRERCANSGIDLALTWIKLFFERIFSTPMNDTLVIRIHFLTFYSRIPNFFQLLRQISFVEYAQMRDGIFKRTNPFPNEKT